MDTTTITITQNDHCNDIIYYPEYLACSNTTDVSYSMYCPTCNEYIPNGTIDNNKYHPMNLDACDIGIYAWICRIIDVFNKEGMYYAGW